MKILWVTSWYPNRFSPQNGDFVQRMAEAVAVNCAVIVLNVIEGKCQDYEIEYKGGEVNEILSYFPRANPVILNVFIKPIRLLRYFKAFWLGLRFVHRNFGKPELIHLHILFPAGYMVWLYRLWNRVPLVVTEHWTGFSPLLSERLKFYHKLTGYLCLNNHTKILPVSTSISEGMQKLGFKGDYNIVPNVINLDLFKPKNNYNLKSPLFTFIHVSSLNEETKNVSGIIRAFSDLSKEIPYIILKIIGNGNDFQLLERLVNKEGIADKVHFTGELDYFLVANEMQNSHAFVLFSNVETFSCVLLEAMSVGLPAISTKCGGISEWIKENEGILVEIGDEDGLKAAMERILKKYSDYKPGIRRGAVVQCSKEIVGSQIFEIYNNILNINR